LVTIDPVFIEAADVDPNTGIVLPNQSNQPKVTDIELSDSKLNNLENSTKIIVVAIMNSNPGDPTLSVKVLNTYKLQINIGVQTEFAISTG